MLDSLSEWILAASIFTLLAYLIGTWTHSHFYKMNAHHLKPVPFFGSMAPLVLGRLSFADFINDLYKKLEGHKYGGVFQFMKPVIIVRDPELIKMVAIKDFEFFMDHRSSNDEDVEDVEPLLAKGLMNLKGQKWKDMRSTLSPAFTSSKMKSMFVLITECGQQLGDFLKTCIQDKNMPVEGCKIEREGDMLVVELKDLFTRYTNDVIATSAFGIGCDSLSKPKNEFYEMGRDMTTFGVLRTLIFLGYMMSPKLMKYLKIKFLSKHASHFFRSLCLDTMATRETKDIFRPDMIHLLMQAKKETNGMIGEAMKPKWEDDDLIAQAIVFFFAGFDTASTSLCFTSLLLAAHPDIQSRLQKEIDEAMENDEGKLTYETVHSMKYLDMVVSEGLRMYPPALLTDRGCIKTYTIKSEPPCTLQKGQSIWIPVYALHHDPKYFPNPEKFDPERFSDENKDNIKQCTYLPFGLGPRSCIANRFALMESKIALVHLLTRFNLRVVSKTPIPIQIKKRGLNLTVDGGFWLGLEQRAT